MNNAPFKDQPFYKTHSACTDLSQANAKWLADLPATPEQLFAFVQNWVIHEQECQWGNYEYAKTRYHEAEVRSAQSMVNRLFELNSNLYQTLSREERLICNCRGASLLFCALLRQQGIPARLNVGFVSYHPIAKFNMDHVVVEYWDESSQEVRFADPLVNEAFKQNAPHLSELNAINIQKGEFIPAEEAWLAVRNNQQDAFSYGVGLFKNRRGLFTIRNRLMQQCAARLKIEMQPGDLWGYMLLDGPSVDPKDEVQLNVLDRVATALKADDLESLQQLYQNTPALKVPSIVINHSSLDGVKAVELELQGESICELV